MYEVGGPNPKGGGVFPLDTKIPQVFHRSGKVFQIKSRFKNPMRQSQDMSKMVVQPWLKHICSTGQNHFLPLGHCGMNGKQLEHCGMNEKVL